jgi:hypothetical protein
MARTLEPSVGIFWGVSFGVEQRLIADGAPLSAAEAYGECLTYGYGHYEVWEAWREAGFPELREVGLKQKLLRSEYETFPRGRIVYDCTTETFWIYADRRLQRSETVDLIKQSFGLAESPCLIRSDFHYRETA